MVDVVDEVDAIAADHGLRQVVHPHVATLVETADELERFLDASDVPICLDTGHVTLGGADAVDLAERCAPTESASSTSRTSASTSPPASAPASSG